MKRQFLAAVIIAIQAGAAYCNQPVDNAELAALYAQDDTERTASVPDWAAITEHDQARSVSVNEMIKTGSIHTSVDYFRAASILLHGQTLRNMQLSYATSAIGIELDPNNREIKKINASAWDRIMLQRKRPQWYATQYLNEGDNGWQLYNFDSDVFADEERYAGGGRTLKQVEDHLNELRTSDSKNGIALPKRDSALSSAPSSLLRVMAEDDRNTMHELAARDSSLGLLWFVFSRMGIQLNPDNPSTKIKLSFISHDPQETQEVIDGKREINKVGQGGLNFGHATYVEYTVTKDDANHLILDIAYDDKVLPGPAIKPNYYKHFKIIAESVNNESQKTIAKFKSVEASSS